MGGGFQGRRPYNESEEAMMTPDELKAIEDRANAATAGGWLDVSPNYNAQNRHDACTEVVTADYERAICHVYERRKTRSKTHKMPVIANARFIAHARQDIPALLSEVRHLQAELALRGATQLEMSLPDSGAMRQAGAPTLPGFEL